MTFSSDVDGESEIAEDGSPLMSNVLVVDDEAVVRDVFARLLGRESDIVTTLAVDAEQGLALLRNQRFDVLITDKNLPGMGGIELISQARQLRPNIEAIMITGYPSAESVIAALAAGASDYLVKPFDDLQVVRAKVRATLERRSQRALSRERARAMAKMASELLSQGKDAPEPAWAQLEDKFTEYERAIRQGNGGKVLVVGSERPAQVLSAAGLNAEHVPAESPRLRFADVVVIDTSWGEWRQLAEQLRLAGPDLLLLASPQSDLPDLLEALSLHVELIGFGGKLPPRALVDRVKMLLMRRALEAAQSELASALAEFHGALSENSAAP